MDWNQYLCVTINIHIPGTIKSFFFFFLGLGITDRESLETCSLWEDAPHCPGQLSGGPLRALWVLSPTPFHPFQPSIFPPNLEVPEYAVPCVPQGLLSVQFWILFPYRSVHLYFTFVNSLLYLLDSMDLSWVGTTTPFSYLSYSLSSVSPLLCSKWPGSRDYFSYLCV